MVDTTGIVLGVVLFVLGVLGVHYAYAVARFQLRFDLNSSEADSTDAEPTSRNVRVAKLLSLTLAGVGVVVVVLSVLG